jgi:flagellar basal body P-ring protein FlgI
VPSKRSLWCSDERRSSRADTSVRGTTTVWPLEKGSGCDTSGASVTRTVRLPWVTLQTLVRGLNQVGLKPTDIIAILQAVKTAGALQAELVVQPRRSGRWRRAPAATLPVPR